MQMIKARPTTYKGIQMRSRLEAHFAAMLDGWPNVTWEYEPTCFAGPNNQWLPDFRVTRSDEDDYPGTEYIEVKPWVMAPSTVPCHLVGEDEIHDHFAREEAVDAVLAKMETAWLSSPDASLFLIFADVKDGRISRYLALGCPCPGEPWQFGAGDLRYSQPYDGMGQGQVRVSAEYRALRRHSIGRMKALGVKGDGSW